MNKKIKNDLKNVKIGGNYTGGDSNISISTDSAPTKQKWVIPIVVALIGASALIITAFINQNSSKEESSSNNVHINAQGTGNSSVHIEDNRVSATGNSVVVLGNRTSINIKTSTPYGIKEKVLEGKRKYFNRFNTVAMNSPANTDKYSNNISDTLKTISNDLSYLYKERLPTIIGAGEYYAELEDDINNLTQQIWSTKQLCQSIQNIDCYKKLEEIARLQNIFSDKMQENLRAYEANLLSNTD